MTSRTVKFSDLLTRPAEFAPIEAPPSPSSQLDTLSTTDSDTEEETDSSEKTAATSEAVESTKSSGSPPLTKDLQSPKDTEATTEPSLSMLPTTTINAPAPSSDIPPVAAAPSDSQPAKMPPSDTPPSDTPPITEAPSDSQPANVPSSDAPLAAVPSIDSQLASAPPTTSKPQDSKPTKDEPARSPNDTLTPADTGITNATAVLPSADEASKDIAESSTPPTSDETLAVSSDLPSVFQEAVSSVPSIPPLPEASMPGSIFNLQGLQKAFPMQPTSLQGFSVVPFSEAEATARQLGLKTPKNFSVPSVSRLPDGSVILASPTTAVSMARISPSCSAALGNAGVRPLTEEIMGLVEKFRRAPNDDILSSKLAEALRKLQKSDLPSCDPSFAAALSEARSFFGKLNEATSRKTAAELTYLKHVEEFRSMKKDLRALSDVVQADGKAVVAAREKVVALRKKNLQEAGAQLFTVSSKLQQLGNIARRLH